MIKKILPFLIIFITALILYYPVFSTYFSQDDFFHFKVSQTDGSLGGFLYLFGFHPFQERGIAFYRPISRELPFNISFHIFGLNSLPFRIFSFLIHLINIYLVYILVQKIFKKLYLSYFVSFFFGITAANVATLYYLAGGIQTLLATTSTLCSIIFFHHYLKSNKLKYKIFSFLTFLLAISSHEQAIIIPILLTGLILISIPLKHIKRFILDILPYFLAVSILLYLEFFKIGFSSSEQQYHVVFNIKAIINSLFWYSNWALGIPETLIDFVFPGFRLNPTLLRYWSNYYIFIFPSYFMAVISILFAAIYLLIKKGDIFINKNFLFVLIWFPLGLIPVLLLPLHKSTHYLEISLPAFWTLIGFIMFSFYKQIKIKYPLLSRICLSLIIADLIILSSVSAILGSTNYWAATRGKLAKQLITQVKNAYPKLPKGSIVYFENDPTYPYLTKEWGGSSKQASIILNGSDALQLLYGDNTLKVYYEDFETPSLSEKNIYSLVAKIY